MNKKIIIIGGGIGGLATAGCLHIRCIESVVYERAAELREVGAALGLWPNATRVLQRMGLLDDLMTRAHVPSMGVLRDWRGKTLVQMAALKTDVPSVFAHRADLHQVLLSALPKDNIHLNKTCTQIERREQQVRAHFTDGTTSDWAEGLIGADGIRSAVRQSTLADGEPTYRNYVAWRGVAEFDPGKEFVGESWGYGQRFGFIPLGRGRVGWWATANKPGELGRQTCAESPATWKDELLRRFRNWHAPIPKLLQMTPESAFLCNLIADRKPAAPPQPWGAGAVTLLGDAAHPTTPNLGQGACMAIEDAAVIAHALVEISDVETAFRAYEAARFHRTAGIVRESLKMGAIGQWENRLACGLRNFMVRLAPTKGVAKQIRDLWLYDAWEMPIVNPKKT